VVRFVENSLSTFDQLSISCADIRHHIPCVLGNGVGGAAQSTEPVTLYITVNITPPNHDDSPAEGATKGRIQFPTAERVLPLSHHQPVETGNIVPQSREEVPPTSALRQADEAMRRIVPIDESNASERNAWERALGRIKWVMDALGPIVEVRVIVISFDVLG
jgi:hypothetical protein